MHWGDILLGVLIVVVICVLISYVCKTKKPERNIVDKYDEAWSDTINRCQLEDLTGLPRIRPYTLETNVYSNTPAT